MPVDKILKNVPGASPPPPPPPKSAEDPNGAIK